MHGAVDRAALDREIEAVGILVELVQGREGQLRQGRRGLEPRHAEGNLGGVGGRGARAVEVARREGLRDHRQAFGGRRAAAGRHDGSAVLEQIPALAVSRAVGVRLESVPLVLADPSIVLSRRAQPAVIVVIRVSGSGDHVERAGAEHLHRDLVRVRAGYVVGAAGGRRRRVAELDGGDHAGGLALLLGQFGDREQGLAGAVDIDGVVEGLLARGDRGGRVAGIGVGRPVPLVAGEAARIAQGVRPGDGREVVVLGGIVDRVGILRRPRRSGDRRRPDVEGKRRLRGGREGGSIGDQHLAGGAGAGIAVGEALKV